jgi:GntR family transcriptional regulator, carbon starvation induced regulator
MTLKQEKPIVTVSEAHGASDTLSERAAMLIEWDILAGRLEPGSRLGIHALSAQYAIGATPLREGISRLVARGLVRATGQRGFRVAAVSRADLEDITALRTVIEAEALRLSMAAGDDEWEAGILAAQHRLTQKLLRDPETMREGTPEFDALHKAFHRSLIAACGSERMLTLHDDLYMQAYRYRRVMMGRFEDPELFLSIHRELADLVIARDIPNAIEKLRGHLASTLEVVYGTD